MLFKGPMPKFKYEPNQIDRGLCVSGGSGITPMYQLISYSLSLPEDKTKWTLVFSNVTEQDIRTCMKLCYMLIAQCFAKNSTTW
jgi:NAD(P)H-flavin reductase